MEGLSIQFLLICVLLGYGAGITTAIFLLAQMGRGGYSAGPVVVENRSDPTGGSFGCLALLGVLVLLAFALILTQMR
jgi:hypothetical protein